MSLWRAVNSMARGAKGAPFACMAWRTPSSVLLGLLAGAASAADVPSPAASAVAVPAMPSAASAVASAQLPGAPYPLAAAVADAVLRNPSVGVAKADLNTAGLLRETAEWGRYPTLSVNVAPGLYSSARITGSSRAVRIDQPLWTGGRITGQIDSAKAQEKSAASGEVESRRAVAEQAAVSYVNWVGTVERLRIAIEGRSVFEKLLSYVQRRQAAGAGTQSDVSVAQARLAAAAVQREQLQAELDHATSELRSLVAGPVGRPVPVESPPVAVTDADIVEQLYVDQSNVLRQRQADVDAAVANAAAQRGEALPTVLLRLERSGSNVDGANVPAANRISLALDYTPQPGLAAYTSIRAAESRIQSAQERLRGEELDVRLRARTHVTDLLSADRQLVDLRPQIDELRGTAESYMRQFEAGKRTWIDVLNAYREQLDAQVSLSRAQTQRDQNALHLMANTGTLSPWIASLRQ